MLIHETIREIRRKADKAKKSWDIRYSPEFILTMSPARTLALLDCLEMAIETMGKICECGLGFNPMCKVHPELEQIEKRMSEVADERNKKRA